MTPIPTTLLALVLAACGGIAPAAPAQAAEAPASAPRAPSSAFDAAAEYSEAHGGLALAVRDAAGELVFEHYGPDFKPENALPLYAAGHGFWAVAALAAQEDGLLELDAPVANWVPEWQGVPAKQVVLVRQLIDMTAGLDPNPKPVRSNFTVDRYKAAISSRMTGQAGEQFRFGPSTWMVLGVVLGNASKESGEDAWAYLSRRLLQRLQIESHEWERDRAGNPMIPFGAYLTAREWTKFGVFLLRGGRVGEEQVVDAELLAQVRRPCAVQPDYGLGFWLSGALVRSVEEDQEAEADARPDAATLLAGLPEDLFFSAGLGGQRLYVIPSLGLTVARQGLPAGLWSDIEFLRILLDAPSPAPAKDDE